MKEIIVNLEKDSFLTSQDIHFFDFSVGTLDQLDLNLKKTIRSNLSEYDDQFYNELFNFKEYYGDFPNVLKTDPFYPLLELVKELLTDLVILRETFSRFVKEKVNSDTTDRRLSNNNIIYFRKVFLKDVTELMCDKYTIQVKNNVTRKDIGIELKTEIDFIYRKQIQYQQILIFRDYEFLTKESEDYVESCKYLKILNNTVDKICTLSSDEIVGNETKTQLLDHYVQGCPEFSENILTTTTTAKHLSKRSEGAYTKYNGEESFLPFKSEPNYGSLGFNSQGLSFNSNFCILSSLMVMILLLRKLFKN